MEYRIASIIIGCLLVAPLFSSEIQATGQEEGFSHRDTAHQQIPRFQAGHMFSIRNSRDRIWVDHSATGPRFEKRVELPGDPRVAASLSAVDRAGRISSVIVVLDLDGEIIRIVRVSPFAAHEIGFTANGSLWAIGKEIENGAEKPVHDVVRQYSPDGKLERTLLPRLSLSTAKRHPMWNARLVTSRNYVAVVSNEAWTWTLISSEGLIVSSGSLTIPGGLVLVNGAITDSGRLFVSGLWRHPHTAGTVLYEIDREEGALEAVKTERVYSKKDSHGMLVGAEGEQFVLYVHDYSQFSARLVWASLD